MAKPGWGSKHLCTNCSARFYDMKRVPVTCPACSTEVKITKRPIVDTTAPVNPNPKSANTTGASTENLIVENTTDETILKDPVEADEEEEDMAAALKVDAAQED